MGYFSNSIFAQTQGVLKSSNGFSSSDGILNPDVVIIRKHGNKENVLFYTNFKSEERYHGEDQKRKLNISFHSDIDLKTDSEETQDSESTGKSKTSTGSKGQVWEFIALATIPIVLVLAIPC